MLVKQISKIVLSLNFLLLWSNTILIYTEEVKIIKNIRKGFTRRCISAWLLDAIEQLVLFYSYLKTFDLEISSAA